MKDRLEIERATVCQHLAGVRTGAFQVLDTCRIDNGRVLPREKWASLASSTSKASGLHGIVQFVPAAGSGSRYFQGIGLLSSPPASSTHWQRLVEGAALPNTVRATLEGWIRHARSPETTSPPEPALIEAAMSALRECKALLPWNRAGTTYLGEVLQGSRYFGPMGGHCLIAPKGKVLAFEQHVADLRPLTPDDPIFVLEQGSDLETYRFDSKGDPLRQSDGSLCKGPGGHGQLVRLFPAVRATLPHAKALLIRNIDNLFPAEALAPTIIEFGTFFTSIQSAMCEARTYLRNYLHRDSGPLESGTPDWLGRLEQLGAPRSPTFAIARADDSTILRLARVQHAVFGTPSDQLGASTQHELAQQLLHRYQRPLNLLGLVRNLGKDVGGTPILTRIGSETGCLVVDPPHLGDKCRDILQDPEKAQFFNPVFVIAELTQSVQAYEDYAELFRGVTEREFRGQRAWFVEEYLYELLGNTVSANLLLAEMPREIFFPHKNVESTVRTQAPFAG